MRESEEERLREVVEEDGLREEVEEDRLREAEEEEARWRLNHPPLHQHHYQPNGLVRLSCAARNVEASQLFTCLPHHTNKNTKQNKISLKMI